MHAHTSDGEDDVLCFIIMNIIIKYVLMVLKGTGLRGVNNIDV